MRTSRDATNATCRLEEALATETMAKCASTVSHRKSCSATGPKLGNAEHKNEEMCLP